MIMPFCFRVLKILVAVAGLQITSTKRSVWDPDKPDWLNVSLTVSKVVLNLGFIDNKRLV